MKQYIQDFHVKALHKLTNYPNIGIDDFKIIDNALSEIIKREGNLTNIKFDNLEGPTEDELTKMKYAWLSFQSDSIYPDVSQMYKHLRFVRWLKVLSTNQMTDYGPNPFNPSVYKTYIGGKIVKAVEMTLGQYNHFRGWSLPFNENPRDNGYLVVGLNSVINIEGIEGYVTWIPKDTFKTEFRSNTNLTYGDALYLVEKGERLMRNGWNGKNMFIEHVPAHFETIKVNGEDVTYEKTAHMVLVNINAKTISTWVGSSTDTHARDWAIFEEDN